MCIYSLLTRLQILQSYVNPKNNKQECIHTYIHKFFAWRKCVGSSSIQIIGILFFAGRKCVDLAVIYNKGMEETFAVLTEAFASITLREQLS